MPTDRRLLRFYAYAFLSGLQLTATTWILFVTARGANMGWAEAAYHFAILFGEVPTGIVADLLGRRISMLIGLALGALASAGQLLVHHTFAACLIWGLSGLAATFLSGADTALLYETAVAIGGPDLARKELARTGALRLSAMAAAPALAGVLYQWRPGAPALVTAGVTLLTLLFVLTIPERRPQQPAVRPSMWGQAQAGLQVLFGQRQVLCWPP